MSSVQTRRNAVGINLARLDSFPFQKNLVAFAIGKAMDLVLNGGAIARTDSLDYSGEQRRTVQSRANDLVRARIGKRDVAGKSAVG